MNSLALGIFFSLLSLLVLDAGPLFALTIDIDDLTDKLAVKSDGPGTRVEIDNENEIAKIFDPAFAAFPVGTSVGFTEPGAVPDQSGLTQLSDLIAFTLDIPTNTKFLLFNSDPDDGFLKQNCATFRCIEESGKPQDVATFLFGNNSGIVVNVSSDVSDAPSKTPQPVTAALFVLGLSLFLLRSVALRGRDRHSANSSPSN